MFRKGHSQSFAEGNSVSYRDERNGAEVMKIISAGKTAVTAPTALF